MFIRMDKTGKSKSGKPYYTYKLLETYKDKSSQKIRHRIILILGAGYSFPESHWKELCALLERKLAGIPQLYSASADLESEAQRLYQLIMRKRALEVPKDQNGIPLDGYCIGDIETTKVRSIGAEYLALKGAKELGLPQIFAELDFSKSMRDLFMALIIARMVHPGSERSTLRWLKDRSGLGLLLGMDFSPMKDMNLHRACDALLSKKDEIEDRIYKNIPNSRDYNTAIALYDLTNTYFEGRPQHPDIKRGHSKEKRFDAPLISLGVMLDWNGFIRKSMIFPGNVSEPKTLDDIQEALKPAPGTMFIMDRGIATANNISNLRERGFRYLVVSKERKRVFNIELSEPLVTASNGEILLYSKLADDGLENRVYCRSLGRFAKEEAMLKGRMEKYEAELEKLNAKWQAQGAKKDLDEANRQLGGLRKEYRIISHYYDVKVLDKQVGEGKFATRIATGVTFSLKKKEGSKLSHPGVYCLRTNDLSLNAEEVWRTYMRLTKVESVFRCLKSELGLRPIFHRKKTRIDCHLFVSILAYQCINMIRGIFSGKRIFDSWGTIVEALSNHRLVTTTISNEQKGTIEVSKAALPEEQHRIYYKAANLPIIIYKKVIKTIKN
ncbi:MAG: IS1634 family transposase [Deltaproteobacteria bacterium]|jgi:transposase|nr:IS1634 family transposase [Deltaproteobacteria bacterium]